MAPPRPNEHLMTRIAVEAQLLAEEKWIIEALTKIKKQRNCLQIERLHLEDLKNKMDKDPQVRMESGSITPIGSLASALDIMQNPNSSYADLDLPDIRMDEESCNVEELNLDVSNSVFDNADPGAVDTEEEDEDIENCVIDMNMFMYGKSASGQTNGDKFDD